MITRNAACRVAGLALVLTLPGLAGCTKPAPEVPPTHATSPSAAPSARSVSAGPAATGPQEWRPGAKVDAASLAELTHKAAAAAGGQRLVGETSLKTMGLGMKMQVDLHQRLDPDPAKVQVQGTSRVEGASAPKEMQVLTAEGATYQRPRSGGKWRAMNGTQKTLVVDPMDAMIRKADVTYLEPKGWGGKSGHHLRLHVQLSDLMGSTASANLPTVPVDLYLDSDYRPVHQEGRHSQPPVEFATVADVTEIGTPVSVEAPSPGEIQR